MRTDITAHHSLATGGLSVLNRLLTGLGHQMAQSFHAALAGVHAGTFADVLLNL